MRSILEARNRHLLREAEWLTEAIACASVPEELRPYVSRIQAEAESIRAQIRRNLSDLALGQDVIVEDVLSNTKQVTQSVRLLSSRMLTPILRASPLDRLCLRLIRWLHAQHPVTEEYPAVFADGECSIGLMPVAPIYYFPVVEQRALLYLPLYFHEFGHLLYRCHKPKMDRLVRELQQTVAELLAPPSSRSDRHVDWQRERREVVVVTWYDWAQEFFCDAVGFVIGGPAFLWAFSTYVGTLDRSDFYRPLSKLEESTHPVPWLRVQVLGARAAKLGFASEVEPVLEEWQTVAIAMGIQEDYHGFYVKEFAEPLHRILDDMVNEVQPRLFLPEEVNTDSELVLPGDSPVSLVHKAWKVFLAKGDAYYGSWEQAAIRSWVS